MVWIVRPELGRSVRMNFAVIVLLAVLILIAVRRLGRIRLAIWQIMAGSAFAVVLGGAITPSEAVYAVDFDVMLFLYGVFVIGHALVVSGVLNMPLVALYLPVLQQAGAGSDALLALAAGSTIAGNLLFWVRPATSSLFREASGTGSPWALSNSPESVYR